MSGCRGAFDDSDKCVMASCDGCRGVSGEAAKKVARMCKCRGRKVSESAKDLSERIVADWKLGEVDQQNPEFEDIIFTLPVSCGVCKRFISNEVKELVAEEVRRDKDRKTKQDPKWIARDWETLRSVVHDSYKD